MKRRTIIATSIAAAAILALGGGYAYSVSNDRPTVGVATVSKTELSLSVSATGSLVAARTAGVYAPAVGTLAAVKVHDGDTVKQGQTLAIMSRGTLRLALAEAKAGYTAAQAEQEAVANGVPSAIERTAANSALSAARSAVSTANKNYRSYLSDFRDAESSERRAMRRTLRDLRTAKATARANLRAAQASLSRLSITGRVGLARQATAQGVKAADRALRLARNNLDQAVLKAPFDGTVSFNGTVEKGSGVAPGVAPLTVTDPSRMQFEAAVFETDIAKVSAQQAATVTLDAFADSFDGAVVRVQSSPETTSTGTVAFPVRISVEAGESRLFAGMSGSAEIAVEKISDALTVPVEAVLTTGTTKTVFVLGADDRVSSQEVRVGASTDTAAEILSGLSAGDQVITSGASSLSDGQQVRVS